MQSEIKGQEMIEHYGKTIPLYGMLAVYLCSRRGAKGLLDMSQAKVCGFRTMSWWFVGTSIAQFGSLSRVREKYGSG